MAKSIPIHRNQPLLPWVIFPVLARQRAFMVYSLEMPTPSSPSQSAEDYLERIHELIEEKGYARVVDIASSLKVKQASVTSMVQKLGELGYLNYEKYRGLVLTEKGKRIACSIQKRHETRQNCDQRGFPFDNSRLRLLIPQPTADVLGSLLPLLRSYLPLFSKTDLAL